MVRLQSLWVPTTFIERVSRLQTHGEDTLVSYINAVGRARQAGRGRVRAAGVPRTTSAGVEVAVWHNAVVTRSSGVVLVGAMP